MTTLIIHLPLSAGNASARYDYVLTPEGQTVAAHAAAPATGLPDASRGIGETVAVVPVDALSWHAVALPNGIGANAPRLRTVLQSLLEDRLLDETEELHLAIAPPPWTGGAVWVAVCNKAWLRQHLQALEAAGRPVTRIVPEFAPHNAPLRLQVLGEPGQAQLVLTGQGIDGGVVRGPMTAGMLALGWGRNDLPASTEVLAEPAVAAQAEQLLQHKAVLQQRAQRLVLALQTPWDLAQFDLASTGRTRLFKRLATILRDFLQAPRWRAARWGTGLLFFAHLAGLNAWAWKEEAALRAQRSAIQGTLTQTFPAVRVVVDAPVQMAREVAALRQATGAPSGKDLEAMLAALGAALPAGKAASGLEFSAGETQLKDIQLDAEALSSLNARLRPLGYSARQDGNSLVTRQETTP